MSVFLPCLGILKLILTVNLILMIFDNFVNSNICHGRYNVSCKTNNCSYHLNFVWKENRWDFKDATYYPFRHHCCNTFGCDKLMISQMERNSKKPVFGPSLLNWVELFYCNTESCILNNGWASNFFELSRGVR